MKFITILISLLFIMSTSSCLYKIPVQQGNILEQDDVDEIKPGMSKRQIAIILGTPAVADPFTHDRWDYINTVKLKGTIKEVKRLTLYFEEDKLIRTEGNYFPEKNSSNIEEDN